MDMRLLEYFLAVAEEGNITKAAQRLHATQPTVSRQIKDLEESLGAALLVRGKRQVALTDAGLLFRQRAREMVDLMEKARRDLAGQNDLTGGTVSVGCVESSASHMLADAIKGFSEKYPRVCYEIYSANGDGIREKLDRGDLDFGILVEPVEVAKYDFLRLSVREIWGVVMRRDDPLAKKDAVGREELLSLPLILPSREIIHDKIAGWLGVDRGSLHIVANGNLLHNMVLLSERGLGYTVCVQGAFALHRDHTLCFRPLEPERTSGHVLAWKKNREFHSAASRFRAFVGETIGLTCKKHMAQDSA